MKTITEFSGVLLQRAAEVQGTFREENPRVEAPAATPAAAEPSSIGESASAAEPSSAGESVEQAVVETAAEPPADDAPAEAAADVSAEEAPAAEDAPGEQAGATEEPSGEPPAPIDLGTGPEAEAVGSALGMEGDRLTRLMEALDVVGRRVGQVRLVRVLQGEPPPQGAQKRGDFYYAVDLAPRSHSPQREGSEGRDGDRRRGPGGRDRGGRPGGPGGARGTGGPPGKGGKFSNDRPSRDGDFREGRGEMPRAGAGWTLTRAPDDRRVHPDAVRGERRDRRPPPGPRFDGRGPRPPMGATGERPPRGPRPERGPSRPPFPGGRGAGPERANGQGQGMVAQPSSGAPGPRRGAGPARPTGAGGPRREPRNWNGPRRGGWDEPPVPDAELSPVVVGPAAEPLAPADPPPAAATENPAPSPGADATPEPTENGS